VVAFFAAGLFVACLVATFGMISLYTNLNVIAESDAGPFVGPIMCFLATLMLLGLLVAHGVSLTADQQRIAPGSAILAAIATYAVFVLGGGVAYAAATGHPLGFLTFTFAMAGSLFSMSTAILAFLVALAYQLVLVGRFRQRGRPQWPWEHKQEP
jgi:hypothetical protein